MVRRITQAELTDTALRMLERTLIEAVESGKPPDWLRFVLAYLAAQMDRREPLDQFWRALAVKDRVVRVRKASYALAMIYMLLGRERDEHCHQQVVGKAERRARYMKV